jgi:chromate transporter
MGANAAVVGLLAAALVYPIGWLSLTSPVRVAFALVAFGLLKFTRCPPWLLVLGGAALGQGLF